MATSLPLVEAQSFEMRCPQTLFQLFRVRLPGNLEVWGWKFAKDGRIYHLLLSIVFMLSGVCYFPTNVFKGGGKS